MPLLATAIAPFKNLWLRTHINMMQHEIDSYNLGIISAKVPPSWSPEKDKVYPLRTWAQDVRLWAVGTDTDIQRQGPVCALRIGGSAKELVRELDVNILANGMLQNDVNGNVVQMTGLEMLIRALERRYGPLAQELEVHVISELLQFRRHAGEDTDSVVNRYNLTRDKALNGAGFDMSWIGFSFLLLTVLGINKTQWPLLLAPTLGALPRTRDEYDAFCQYVRRQGHLTDRNVDTVKNMTFLSATTEEHAQQHTYMSAPLTSWHEPAEHTLQQTYAGQTYDSSDISVEYDDADDGLSSCNSGDTQPDLTDVLSLPLNTAGEQLYLGYRHHKRRWRHFTGGVKRLHFRRKFKGRRKGGGHRFGKKGQMFGKTPGAFKGKGPSKGKRMFYLDEHTGGLFPAEDEAAQTYWTGEDNDDEQLVYIGAGGKFKRKNPKGKDGVTLTCSMCGADDHLIRKCHKNKQGLNFTQHQQQLGKGTGTFVAQSSSSSDNSSQWTRTMYFGTAVPTQQIDNTCSIEIEGQTIVLEEKEHVEEDKTESYNRHYYTPQPDLPTYPSLSSASNASALERQFMFAWFMPMYHMHVRCEGLEGLLVDVGAIGNLSGDRFVKRITDKALKFGHSAAWNKMTRKLTVEGVGKESDGTDDSVTAPICLSDGRVGTFSTPVLPNSDLPALLGLATLSKERALIDCFNKQIVFIGPGGYKLQTSPGSRTYKLSTAKSGHLLLPCDCWETAKATSSDKQLVF